jgi:hypothetical protein
MTILRLLKAVGLVSVVVAYFGLLLPMLISAKSTELVVLGFIGTVFFIAGVLKLLGVKFK